VDDRGRTDAIVIAVTLAVVTGGLARIWLMPAWEGFDEPAHYSYIAQWADQGQRPHMFNDKIDHRPDRWRGRLPTPYETRDPFEGDPTAHPPRPPLVNYHDFFDVEQVSSVDRLHRLQTWWAPPAPPHEYRPDPNADANFQGQHPPGYYALMAPLYRLMRYEPLARQVWFLRTVSFAFAALSLLVWVAGLRLWDAPRERLAWLGAGVWVALWPTFYDDVARIGQDGLGVLLGSLSVYLALATIKRGWRWWRTIAFGVVVAAGIWTKMLAVPLAVGLGLALLWRFRRERLGLACLHLGVAATIALVAGCYVFWENQQLYGTPSGAYVMAEIALGRKTLGAHPLPPAQVLLDMAHFAKTFLWSGSWSWISLPYGVYVLWLPLAVGSAVGLVGLLRERGGRKWVGRAALCLAPMVGGFVLFMILCRSSTGAIGGAAYYLHYLWLVVFMLLGLAWVRLIEGRRHVGRWLGMAGAVGVAAFWLVGHYYLLCTYAGVGIKRGAVGFLQDMPPNICENVREGLARLGDVAWPGPAVFAAGIWLLSSLTAAWLWLSACAASTRERQG